MGGACLLGYLSVVMCALCGCMCACVFASCRRRKDAEHALIREQGHYRSMERLRKGYTTAVRKKKTIKHAAGVDVTEHTHNPKTKEVWARAMDLPCVAVSTPPLRRSDLHPILPLPLSSSPHPPSRHLHYGHTCCLRAFPLCALAV